MISSYALVKLYEFCFLWGQENWAVHNVDMPVLWMCLCREFWLWISTLGRGYGNPLFQIIFSAINNTRYSQAVLLMPRLSIQPKDLYNKTSFLISIIIIELNSINLPKGARYQRNNFTNTNIHVLFRRLITSIFPIGCK